VLIFSGASDIGQGSNSVLSQIAIEELGPLSEQVCVFSGDTDLGPVDLGAYSSRLTLMMGHAALEASRKARLVLAKAVADYFNAHEHWRKLLKVPAMADSLSFAQNRVFVSENPEIAIGFADACELAENVHGALIFSGDYRTKPRGGDYRGGSIGASPAYSCTAHVADVSVDPKSGIISINKIYVAHDCGRAINPMLVRGQMEGSTYMGAAEAVLEHMVTDESIGARKGMLINPSLLDYRIPTTLDTPNISSIIVEKPDPCGPYGAKEAGEGPLHSSIPAIANAIYDAVGVRLFSLPFSPAKLRHLIKEKARLDSQC
jgi:4-hydroxybenzoyl-CoA reductase subunit alpha